MTAADGSPDHLAPYERGVPAYFSGPWTFMRSQAGPADSADVVVIGLPYCGWITEDDVETFEAPRALREASARWRSDLLASGFAPLVELSSGRRRRFLPDPSLVDAGDLSLQDSRDLGRLRSEVTAIVARGGLPVILGGGRGIRNDLSPAVSEGLGDRGDLALGPDLGATGRELEVDRGIDAAIAALPDRPLQVSIDMSAIDSAVAPGCADTGAGALSPQRAIELAWHLGQHELAAVDLVGLVPGRDQGGRTAWLALLILIELLGHRLFDERSGEE